MSEREVHANRRVTFGQIRSTAHFLYQSPTDSYNLHDKGLIKRPTSTPLLTPATPSPQTIKLLLNCLVAL